MIQDEKHWELNNLMTPIVNYFSMYKELDNPKNKSKINGIIKLIEQERKVVHEVMPKILEILSSNERESVGKHEQKEKNCKTCKNYAQMIETICIECNDDFSNWMQF